MLLTMALERHQKPKDHDCSECPAQTPPSKQCEASTQGGGKSKQGKGEKPDFPNVGMLTWLCYQALSLLRISQTVVALAFNINAQEAEAGGSLNSRTA